MPAGISVVLVLGTVLCLTVMMALMAGLAAAFFLSGGCGAYPYLARSRQHPTAKALCLVPSSRVEIGAVQATSPLLLL